MKNLELETSMRRENIDGDIQLELISLRTNTGLY